MPSRPSRTATRPQGTSGGDHTADPGRSCQYYCTDRLAHNLVEAKTHVNREDELHGLVIDVERRVSPLHDSLDRRLV